MSKNSWEEEEELRRKSEIMNNFYKENPVYNGEDTYERAYEIERYLYRKYDNYGDIGGGL